MQGTRGYVHRKQSVRIRIFFLCAQAHYDEFRYLKVFKFCMEKTSNALVSVTEVKIDLADRCTSCDESSCKFLASTL